MGSLTLLDYEVFGRLKAILYPDSADPDRTFSEWVLGYGFHSEGTTDPSFVLLCSPQSVQQLHELITARLPGTALIIEGQAIKVEVCDSVDQLNLTRSLTFDSAGETEPKNSDLANWVQISLGQTLRQVVLQEHRKIILPTYLLRYTPFTSPNLIILRAALGQIHYLHQSRAKGEDEFEQRTVTARMSEITRWSSFSRTSIYRLLHEDPRSQWLVQVENRGSFQNEQGQQISLPNQYLLEPLNLTPGDATDFANYLQEHQTDWQDLDECLIALAKTEKREILSYPYRVPRAGDRPDPDSVMTILHETFGVFDLTAERLTLIDKVRDHLIGDDFIAVPWYLLRRLLPIYGASIVALFMMCQPLLYKNNGVQRDTFWLPGGDQALVDWTGDRSIGKYFPKANAKGRGRPASAQGSSDMEWRSNKRDLLSDFFLRVDARRDDHGMTQWHIQVHEMPIRPQDEKLMSSVYQRLVDLENASQLGDLVDLLNETGQDQCPGSSVKILDRIYRTQISPQMTQALSLLANGIISDFETPVSDLISDFETPAPRLISLFETPEQRLISESATPAADLISEIETHLKILENIKDSIKDFKQSNILPDSSPSRCNSDPELAEDWDLSGILNTVKPEFRKEIMSDLQKQRGFKAWLIHSALNGRVNRPLNLAITQSMQGKLPPDAAARRLADLSKTQLLSLLEKALDQPAGMGYQSDPELRSKETDLQLLMVGEDGRSRALLIQRLIDLLI